MKNKEKGKDVSGTPPKKIVKSNTNMRDHIILKKQY